METLDLHRKLVTVNINRHKKRNNYYVFYYPVDCELPQNLNDFKIL